MIFCLNEEIFYSKLSMIKKSSYIEFFPYLKFRLEQENRYYFISLLKKVPEVKRFCIGDMSPISDFEP